MYESRRYYCPAIEHCWYQFYICDIPESGIICLPILRASWCSHLCANSHTPYLSGVDDDLLSGLLIGLYNLDERSIRIHWRTPSTLIFAHNKKARPLIVGLFILSSGQAASARAFLTRGAAGFPTTVIPGNTSLVTTAPIPITDPLPMMRGFSGVPCFNTAPVPM